MEGCDLIVQRGFEGVTKVKSLKQIEWIKILVSHDLKWFVIGGYMT